jgi:hypothetical protein
MRILALSAFLVFSSVAQAQGQYSVEWKRNSTFILEFYYNGRGVSLEGVLPEDGEFTVTDQDFTIYTKSFKNGFVYSIVQNQFDDKALFFLAEKSQGVWVPMMESPIPARKITVNEDLKAIVAMSAQKFSWDFGQTARSMVHYFNSNPSTQLSSYYDALEADLIDPLVKTVGPEAVEGGVVQQPEGTVVGQPEIRVDQPVVEQPVVEQPLDLGISNNGVDEEPMDDDIKPAPIKRPPAEIPVDNGGQNDGDFTPMDMTDGWDGDEGGGDPQWLIEERERQSKKRRRLNGDDVTNGDIF